MQAKTQPQAPATPAPMQPLTPEQLRQVSGGPEWSPML